MTAWLNLAVPSSSQTVRLLEADPDLAASIDPEARPEAEHAAVAVVHTVEEGAWDAVRTFGDGRGWLGLLILTGFVTRETVLGSDTTVELLGSGDLLRPWDHDSEYGMPEVHVSLTVLQRTRLALLDPEVAARVAPWPELVAALFRRLGERARWLGLRIGISHLDRVDARLLILFVHLAERWGWPAPEGTILQVPLTHALLAALAGARRPSVTTALSALSSRELIVRRGDGSWLVAHDAAREIGRMLAA